MEEKTQSEPEKLWHKVLTWGTFCAVISPVVATSLLFLVNIVQTNAMQDYRIERLEALSREQQNINAMRTQQMLSLHSDVASMKATLEIIRDELRKK